MYQKIQINFALLIFSQMRQQFLVEVPVPSKAKYPSNYVSTTKYNLITFLPLSLIIQFRRYANIYFLVCAVLQSIPIISPLSPFSAVSPLVFVLSLSMAREGYEDFKRYKSDKQNNANITKVCKGKQFQTTPWQRVHTADFVKIQKDQVIPADIISLISSNASGISYVQTSSLDGEKNLKPKISVPETQLQYNLTQMLPNFEQVKMKIACDSPNADINRFSSNVKMQTKSLNFETKINQKNLLLRGCKLKNTEWVIGVTVYTGSNTKVMQNGSKPTTKSSNIQKKVNNMILAILAFEVLCSFGSALDCYFQCVKHFNFLNYLLQDTVANCVQLAAISFGSYFILYSTFIPISLIVSLEFVKLFQGFVMSYDKQMHCTLNDRSLQCHTVSINQELGQIQYILTDKTGTLTCNKMEFKNIVIGKNVYGQDIKLPQIGNSFDFSRITRKFSVKINNPSESQHSMHSFDSRKINYDLEVESQKSNRAEIQLMFFMIATCHQCLKDKDGYRGPSPDQVALLNAAKNIGFQFLQTENKVTTVIHNKKQYKFQILKVIEFDSNRKRMSVIVKHQNIKRIFCKGADSSIQPLLRKGQQNLEFIKQKTKQMAKSGLRSLWFAQRSLENGIDLDSTDTALLQNELNLVGATAIQDRLQDFVAQTIYSLREGGIKFIMLTGDKLQTADNIARSCKMIEQGFLINCKAKLLQKLQMLKLNQSGFVQSSPVIDGSTIDFVQCQKELLQVIQKSNSAVFCRVTPNQKAQIVKIVKKLGKLTLAIGDGANDVNMIQQAHVGVGIFGQEGTQAAQVSNYAIGQFCILWKLLLYYGRLNYMRVSEMILYFFYKNMVFTIVQFAYSFYNLSSGQSFWLSWSITFYNMTFTFFPVVIRAVFQVDLGISKNKNTFKQVSQGSHEDQTVQAFYPKMYIISQKNQLFTNFIFFSWFFLGICQGILCLMITLYGIGGLEDSSGQNSYQTGFYFCQISAYTSVIIVVTIKLALNVKTWNLILVIGFLVPSLGAYALYCYLGDILQITTVSTYTGQLLLMPTFYACQILCILGMFSFDCFLFAIEATKNNFHNYFKYRALQGKRISETNLKQYWLEVQMQTRK